MMSRKVHHLDWCKKSEKDDGIVNIRKARSGVIEAEVGKAGNEGVAMALGTSNQAVCTLKKSCIVYAEQVPRQVYCKSNIIERSGRREFP